MKIGYLCSDVDIPVFGTEGCSVHIQSLANALADQGNELFLMCAALGKPPASLTKFAVHELKPDGLDAVAWNLVRQEPRVCSNNLERDLGSIFFNLHLQRQGARLIEREQPDFLYERYSLFGWGGVELSRRHGLPLILEVNAPLVQEQMGYDKFPFFETARRMDPEIFRAAGAIITVSQWLKDWIGKLGVETDKIHVIPNALSDQWLSERVTPSAAKAKLGLSDARVIGYIGSFQEWHDLRGLFEAFVQVREAHRSARLLLVGRGDGRKKFETMARQRGLADSVIFAGHVSHADVPRYLTAMDIAVVPYTARKDFYFSPLKLFESMGLGVPTVAADIGQVSQIIRHGETGWLYPPGDRAKLSEAILMLLNDPRRAESFGQAARRCVSEHHTWQAVARRVIEIAGELRKAKR